MGEVGDWSRGLESSKIIRTLSTVDTPQFSSDITVAFKQMHPYYSSGLL